MRCKVSKSAGEAKLIAKFSALSAAPRLYKPGLRPRSLSLARSPAQAGSTSPVFSGTDAVAEPKPGAAPKGSTEVTRGRLPRRQPRAPVCVEAITKPEQQRGRQIGISGLRGRAEPSKPLHADES